MGTSFCAILRDLYLISNTERYGAAMASHRHQDHTVRQTRGARASYTSAERQEEAQWEEKADCDSEEV